MASTAFLEDLEAINADIHDLESLCTQLETLQEHRKTDNKLRSTQYATAYAAIRKAQRIKILYKRLKSSNDDDATAATIKGLKEKCHDIGTRFHDLSQKETLEYRKIVEKSYCIVTGEKPNDKLLDRLIKIGEGETYVKKAKEKPFMVSMKIKEMKMSL